MASSGSGYDLSAATFSPDGRIFQVEYAAKAVENAGTVIGINAKDGVVLGVVKPLYHKMIVPTTASYKRIHTVDIHAGVATTGFLPDARVLVSRAQEEAADWFEHYGSKIPPHVLSERLGHYVHYFTLHGALRPFGASCVMGAYDVDTKECGLYMVEPNGAAYKYYGVATGKGKQVAKTELEKLNLHKEPKLDVSDAVKHVAKILILLHKENKESDGKPMELELSWICEASKWRHTPIPKDVVTAAKEWANAQLEEDDDEEEEEEAMEEG
jgi:20S proteasome subunit alpha 7